MAKHHILAVLAALFLIQPVFAAEAMLGPTSVEIAWNGSEYVLLTLP